jgi:hypothetical protein
MSSNEVYADSFQALEIDRRMSADSSTASVDDWFDDETNALIAARQKLAERKRLAGLPGRIGRAISQMQIVCGSSPLTHEDAQDGAQGVSMTSSKELSEVPPAETALQVFTTEKGLEPWLQQVRLKVDEFNKTLPELTTQKGRDRYASMAHQIAKSKTAL